MRGLWAFLLRCWVIERARYRVHLLEADHDYHRLNLNYHAERAARLHRAIIESRREVNRLTQEPEYIPSVHQVSGRR